MLIRNFKTWFSDTISSMHEHSVLREHLVMGKSVLMPKILENGFKADHADTHKESVCTG